MARLRYRLVLPALLLGLAGCAGSGASSEAPQTAGTVDLQRYQGTWYEQARLPMFFQRNCAQSEAHYRLQEDGAVGVLNRCRTLDGEWLEAKGLATPQMAGQTDKLWVRFDNWFSRLFPGVAKGDYWVLYLDDDYRTALVGNPNREYLWLLTREAEIPLETRTEMLEQAQARGYDTSELIWRVADAGIGQ
ncbi:Outer membrane lipoprotein Blc [Pseudomonas sp. 8AS]|uniref:lipocalin family protein n=1 Tax=Pseudomonas sp. 8AS TaxID=2653163 RepID=UPI0012F2F26F|nr:lipocalin family protein [Pseudomonas sp. 8AS]VXB20192.1 Outer membrane lipoprotein Blc [Pseudomonas sp. 8AS]